MSEPDAKRRKVSLACVECRDRKRKCDGGRPTCGGCSRRNPQLICVYTDETLKRGSSSYVESLRSKIKALEAVIADSNIPHGPLSPPESEATRSSNVITEWNTDGTPQQRSQSRVFHVEGIIPPDGSSYVDNRVPSKPMVDTNVNFINIESSDIVKDTLDVTAHAVQSPDLNDTIEEEDNALGIGVMGTLSINFCADCTGVKEQPGEYSTPSDVVDFDRQIRCWTTHAGSEMSRSPSSRLAPKVCRCLNSGREGTRNLEGGFSLPRRSDADSLVSSYFERVHTLYPYLHRPTFMENYVQLWQPHTTRWAGKSTQQVANDKGIGTFNALLNAVLALGSRFSPHLGLREKLSTSETFYNRAMASLNIPILGRPSPELVQTLLLIAQYLQSTQLWELCWSIVGIAIRSAQAIGLHIEPSELSKQGSDSPTKHLDEEMRRRIWGGCVTMDRVLAMLYGKPPMLHPRSTSAILLSLPSKTDEELLKTVKVSGHRPRNLDFYVESLKLVHHLGDILDTLSGQKKDGNTLNAQQDESVHRDGLPPTKLQKMLALDNILLQVQAQLPSHLQPGVSDPGSIFHRQAKVLRARYLHMRLFLLRPVLLALHRNQQNPMHPTSTEVETSLGHVVESDGLIRIGKTCVAVARALIDLVYTDAQSNADPSIVWWYGVYYIYTCATIIFAARLSPCLSEVNNNGKTLEESFSECLRCLMIYGASAEPARRCSVALQLLHQKGASNNLSSPWVPTTQATFPSSLNFDLQAMDFDSLVNGPLSAASTFMYDGIDFSTLGTTYDEPFDISSVSF